MTRPTSTWKAIERKVAEVLGGQRIPASGNGAIKGDVRHDRYLVEVKYGKQVPLRIGKWYKEAVKDALTEAVNRGDPAALVPLLVVQRPREDPLVIMRLSDFVALADAKEAATSRPVPAPLQQDSTRALADSGA